MERRRQKHAPRHQKNQIIKLETKTKQQTSNKNYSKNTSKKEFGKKLKFAAIGLGGVQFKVT